MRLLLLLLSLFSSQVEHPPCLPSPLAPSTPAPAGPRTPCVCCRPLARTCRPAAALPRESTNPPHLGVGGAPTGTLEAPTPTPGVLAQHAESLRLAGQDGRETGSRQTGLGSTPIPKLVCRHAERHCDHWHGEIVALALDVRVDPRVLGERFGSSFLAGHAFEAARKAWLLVVEDLGFDLVVCFESTP